MPPVQGRKLDPLPKTHRRLKKAVRTKRMRKSRRKEKVETHHAPILPTPFVPPQSEEDEVVDTKPAVFSALEGDPDLPSEDRLQSQRDKGARAMHQECQIQPCELSVSQEPGPSSPAVTSLTFSRSRKQKAPRREDTKQAGAGGDAKALRPALLRGLVETPHVQPLSFTLLKF
uniref:Uncharacterized protein n=1 Tax=Panthera tigris altaica TaxID=74533 RepID=A0A8C9JQN7_PANTA